MKNLIKYTLGLPILLVFSLFFLLMILIIILVNYLIVEPCRFVLRGYCEPVDCLFLENLVNIWKPI